MLCVNMALGSFSSIKTKQNNLFWADLDSRTVSSMYIFLQSSDTIFYIVLLLHPLLLDYDGIHNKESLEKQFV